MFAAEVGVDYMKGFLTPIEAFLDVRKENPVPLLLGMKEGADVTLGIQDRAGEPNRLAALAGLSWGWLGIKGEHETLLPTCWWYSDATT
jgi:hypothetical protein